ncbi:MAG: SOS response-associated peptidase [Planctomycetota bacterium]
MCGRFAHLYKWLDVWAFAAPFGQDIADPPVRYNVPPKASVPLLRAIDGTPEAAMLQWWLVPHWSKTPDTRYTTFNAKSEDAASKPAFREPFRKRRCVIPASGFFEWQRLPGGRKQPKYIYRADGDVLYFAGLWDRWVGPDGDETLDSCTVLTTDSNAEMREVHSRMPCILERSEVEAWVLDPSSEPDSPKRLLRPAADGVLAMHDVDPAVGNVRHDGPQLIESGHGLF